MPEIRLNPVTREWVIIAIEKAKRPEEFRQRRERRCVPEHVDTCPFCLGNEDKTPQEIMRLSAEGRWKVRVIPNKYPVLLPGDSRLAVKEGLKQFVAGKGRHEVIIESPVHNSTLALMEIREITEILTVYKGRFLDMYQEPDTEHVIVFRNQGSAAGTSLQHPHSQVIGIPVTPLQIAERCSGLQRYLDHTGSCLMCDTLAFEQSESRRVVLETECFLSFIPYAALSPFHLWTVPKRHVPSFGDIMDNELGDLAYHVKTVLMMIYHRLDNPDFNYVVRSARPATGGNQFFHWYLSIIPRVAEATGFELGSGMYVNPSIPEENAEFLRKVRM